MCHYVSFALFVFSIMYPARSVDINSMLPNVVFILTDDLGSYAPGFKNLDLVTPALDEITQNGVFLEEHYSFKFCAPSRGSLMTGRFPYKLSATRNNYPGDEEDGLDIRFDILPKKLDSAGYVSHHVGKWHLGYCDERFTAVKRGFRSSNGYHSAKEDHFNQTIGLTCTQNNTNSSTDVELKDIWVNNAPGPEYQGQYNAYRFTSASTDIINQHNQDDGPLFLYLALQDTHSPLQAPQELLDLFPEYSYLPQKTHYAMVAAVDKTVAAVVKALQLKNMWNQTLLIWTTDNGSPVNAGSNWPLRGLKNSNWEGGTRTPAIVSGGFLPTKMHGRSLKGMVHICDWYATILALAGQPWRDWGPPSASDGINMWPWLSGEYGCTTVGTNKISQGSSPCEASPALSPRSMVVYEHNLYQGPPAVGAIRIGRYKLLIGEQSSASWYGGSSNNYFVNNASDPHPDISVTACSVRSPCLFDLSVDPSEHKDLSLILPEVVAAMRLQWELLTVEYHPPVTAPIVQGGYCARAIANGGYLSPYVSLAM